MRDFKKDFPLLLKNDAAYLDNGATTQKPRSVLAAVERYYETENANPHRGTYALSEAATNVYENARAKVARFIGAARPEEVVFTRGATEALNLVAYAYGLRNVEAGDEIAITVAEHHSDLVPWQYVARTKGATLKYIYLNADGTLRAEDIEEKITERTKIVAAARVSNVLGLKNDLTRLIEKAHSVGAVVVVDGAQSVPHEKTDVQELGADFLAFSGHKMLAPMGIGVLYGRYELLSAMQPFLFGGDMIDWVEEQETTFAEVPARFEAGTQNVGGAAGLAAAIDYLEGVGFEEVERRERELMDYVLPKMKAMPFIELYGCDRAEGKTGIITFNVKDVHPHDAATILDSFCVAVRAGHHCAQPLMKYLDQNATLRASFYFYNTIEDADRFLAALPKIREVMGLD